MYNLEPGGAAPYGCSHHARRCSASPLRAAPVLPYIEKSSCGGPCRYHTCQDKRSLSVLLLHLSSCALADAQLPTFVPSEKGAAARQDAPAAGSYLSRGLSPAKEARLHCARHLTRGRIQACA